MVMDSEYDSVTVGENKTSIMVLSPLFNSNTAGRISNDERVTQPGATIL